LPGYIFAKLALCCGVCKPIRRRSCRRWIVFKMVAMGWRFVFCVACWIRIRKEGFQCARKMMGASGRPVVLVGNHLSFLDTMLVLVSVPPHLLADMKVFAAGRLKRMPVLGTLLRAMGHLLVPFKTDTQTGGWEVDKEVMARRQLQLEEHIRQGGIAAWFPEGKLNDQNPLEVLQFRAGGFSLPAKLDVEIWCLAFVGNQDCWPRQAAFGGAPATIDIGIFSLCASSHELLATGPGLEDEREASVFLADKARDAIQNAIKRLAAQGRFSGKE